MKWYTEDWVVGLFGLALLVSVVFGYSYGMYRFGRYIERRELTSVFVRMTQLTYEDGHSDGLKLGKKEGLKSCDDMLSNSEDGRY